MQGLAPAHCGLPTNADHQPEYPSHERGLLFRHALRKCKLPTYTCWNEDKLRANPRFHDILRALPFALMASVTSVGVESCFGTARQVRSDTRTGLSIENLSFLTCAAFNKITFAGPPRFVGRRDRRTRNADYKGTPEVVVTRFAKKRRVHAGTAAGAAEDDDELGSAVELWS